MKRTFYKLGISGGLILLAIIFSLLAVGSLIASAHSAQSPTTPASSTIDSQACQDYLQGLSQRLNLPVSTLEEQLRMTQGNTLSKNPCN